MQIRVGKYSGFCFGVRRAVEKAEQLAKECGRIYTYGEIIHNKAMVERLAQKGAVPVDSLEGLPEGTVVLIRAHGVPPEVFEECRERGFRVEDATCPYVKRIHQIVERAAEEGRTVLIVGNAAHPEVIGIRGRAGKNAYVVTSSADVKGLPSEKKAAIVAQTTIYEKQFEEVVTEAEKKYRDLQVFRTICDTTINRQKEAKTLAESSDAVVVIGGRHSSNTQKLAELCRCYCKEVFSVENTKEIVSILAKLRSHDIISVVAGASTPNWMILEVITSMSELEKTAAQEEEMMDAAQSAAEDFTEAFEKTLVRIRNGQILTGTVVQIADGEVCVNIGYKSDGFIPKSEFSSDGDVNPADSVKVGDEIEVEVLKVNDGEGNVLLSHKSVEAKKAWEQFIHAAEDESAVYDAVGKEVVKGGLIASINGIRAFVPASQVSNRYVENLSEYVGAPLRLMIIEVDDKKKRVVASQKKVLLAEAEAKKKEMWSTLEVGAKVKGVVRRLTDFGAFVDIGGIDGLVHVTELAWGRVKHPSDVLKIGDEIEVLILAVDPEKERVSLSYKQLQPKPWTTAAERYPVGSIVEGKVVRIVPFGAFVSLEPTIDGLVHISQVATTRIAKVEDELKVGDIIRAKVLEVNPEAKRISLSRREVLLEEMPPIEDIIMDEADYAEAPAEEETVEIPPIESATTSLADLFPKLED